MHFNLKQLYKQKHNNSKQEQSESTFTELMSLIMMAIKIELQK